MLKSIEANNTEHKGNGQKSQKALYKWRIKDSRRTSSADTFIVAFSMQS